MEREWLRFGFNFTEKVIWWLKLPMKLTHGNRLVIQEPFLKLRESKMKGTIAIIDEDSCPEIFEKMKHSYGLITQERRGIEYHLPEAVDVQSIVNFTCIEFPQSDSEEKINASKSEFPSCSFTKHF